MVNLTVQIYYFGWWKIFKILQKKIFFKFFERTKVKNIFLPKNERFIIINKEPKFFHKIKS